MINIISSEDLPIYTKANKKLFEYAFMSHVVEGKWVLVITQDEKCYADIMRQSFSEAPEMAKLLMHTVAHDSKVYALLCEHFNLN